MRRQTGPAGTIERRMRVACWLALVALVLIVWSLVHPAPLPVVFAMSVGQVIGTASFAFFLFAIIADIGPGLRDLGRTALRPTPDVEPKDDPTSRDES